MAGQKIRIKLKAYDHNLIDAAAEKIVEAVKRTDTSVRSHTSSHRKGNSDDTSAPSINTRTESNLN